MQSYHYPAPNYRLPAPRYLPPPTDDIPLSEDEVEAHAMYIPSRLIGPLLDFEGRDFNTMYQNVGDCIARQLTKAVNPARPFIYHRGGDTMVFTTETEDDDRDDDMSITIVNSEYSVEDIPPESGLEPLFRFDYRHPAVESLKDINSLDLVDMCMLEIPQQWRKRAIGVDRANAALADQPSYFKKRVEFLEQRTPAFIQNVRDELSRRYIFMTTPEDPEFKRQFLKALEQCRLAGVLTNLQKGVNARQRRVEQHGVSELAAFKQLPSNMTSRVLRKLVGPTIKHRKKRKARKTRRRK